MTTEAAVEGSRINRPVRVGHWRRLSSGTLVPVIVLVTGILLIWYVAAIFMNRAVVLTLMGDDANPTVQELIWETWSSERPLLPAPHQILVELQKSVLDVSVTSKRSLVFHAEVTLETTLIGFAIGSLGGIVLAIGIVNLRVLQKALMPWIIASQTVPILAIAPIVVVVLGNIGITGTLPKALISAYLCFFPVTIGMVKGLSSPDLMLIDLMRTYHASANQTFWKLRWPAAVPYLFTSLKVAVAISLVGAIVAELPTGAQAGLGARLLSGSYYGQTIQIWAALIAAATLAAIVVFVVGLAERITLSKMGARR
jgi:NitT/TauT family transport system permease protein